MFNNLSFRLFLEAAYPDLGGEDIGPKSVVPMDCTNQTYILRRIGQAIVKEQVDKRNFEGFLLPIMPIV
jgi:hypothetical protein